MLSIVVDKPDYEYEIGIMLAGCSVFILYIFSEYGERQKSLMLQKSYLHWTTI